MHDDHTHEARSRKPEPPYCWQNKKALDALRSIEGESTAFRIAVYVALTELASDAGSEVFDAEIGRIMMKAGVKSDRTVRTRLSELESIGVIRIQANRANEKTRLASTFTLLPFGNKYRRGPVSKQHSSLPSNKRTEGNEHASGGARNSGKRKLRTAPFFVPSFDQLLELGYEGDEAKAIEEYHGRLPDLTDFLPVNTFTRQTQNVIELFDVEAFHAFVDQVASAPSLFPHPKKFHHLVRESVQA